MKYTAHYRRKNNSWQVIISWKDSSGKWRQKSKQGFQLKSDAKQYEEKLLAQIKKRHGLLKKPWRVLRCGNFVLNI